jgi:ATP-dependent Clp protease adaptor protein ClpS
LLSCSKGIRHSLDAFFIFVGILLHGFLESEPIIEYYSSTLLCSEQVSSRTSAVDQQTTIEHVSENDTLIQAPAKVILFNDEIHTFEEVIGQLIKALQCGQAKAEALTWEVHNSGKATVFEGPMDNCLKVSAVLEEIALHTQIEI